MGDGAHAAAEAKEPMDAASAQQWPLARAWSWHNRTGWHAGANFVPSSASNQLEMWRDFDLGTIARELRFARATLGFTAVRVFLHDLLWSSGPLSLLERIDAFLSTAQAAGIRGVLFVLFDGVWNPEANLSSRAAPIVGVHNSRWVQSPSK